MFEDYYKTVQVHPECDTALIPKMRGLWAKLIHPDIAKSAAERAEFTVQIQRINHAIDILSDPQKRLEYNKKHPYFSITKPASGKEPESKTPEPEKEAAQAPDYEYKSDIKPDLWKYLDSKLLFNISRETKERNLFEGFDRKTFYNFGKRIEKNEPFTKWQRDNFSKYIKMAQQAGLIK